MVLRVKSGGTAGPTPHPDTGFHRRVRHRFRGLRNIFRSFKPRMWDKSLGIFRLSNALITACCERKCPGAESSHKTWFHSSWISINLEFVCAVGFPVSLDNDRNQEAGWDMHNQNDGQGVASKGVGWAEAAASLGGPQTAQASLL